jgi:hypothetical protein
MGETTSRLGSFFDLATIPVSVFVDAQGKIADRWVGFEGEEGLSKKLSALLSVSGK